MRAHDKYIIKWKRVPRNAPEMSKCERWEIWREDQDQFMRQAYSLYDNVTGDIFRGKSTIAHAKEHADRIYEAVRKDLELKNKA